MSVSNKTLSILLLAAIVISLGGTFISISRLSSISGTTGYLTSSDTGSVNLTINDSLKIVTYNYTVNFGICALNAGGIGYTVNTNGTNGGTPGCANTPDPLTLSNEGNLNANVTIDVSKFGTDQGGNFLNSSGKIGSDSSLKFALENIDGCVSPTPTTFTAFGSGNNNTVICPTLTYGGAGNSFYVHFEVDIPNNAPPGADSVVITFSAVESD